MSAFKPVGKYRQWKPDPDAEEILKSKTSARIRGVEWVHVSKIMLSEAMERNTRLGGTRHAKAFPDYLDQMESGDIFPRPIYMIQPDSLYDIIGGMTRTRCAVELKDEWIEALILHTAAPKDANRFRFKLNRYHGERESTESALQFATREVAESGGKVKIADAAEFYGVKEGSLSNSVRAEKLRIRCRSEFNIDLSGRPSHSVVAINHPSRTVVQAMAAALHSLPKISNDRWGDLARRAKAKPTEAEVLAELQRLVAEERANSAPTSKRVPVLASAGHKLCQRLRDAASAAEGVTMLDIADENRPALLANWQTLSERMFKLMYTDKQAGG